MKYTTSLLVFLAGVFLHDSVVLAAQDTPSPLYVREDGAVYGTGDGSSWANAYGGFSDIDWNSASIQPGTVIFFAGGTYTSSIIAQKSGNSDSPIIVRKATIHDHGTHSGWDSALSSIAHFVDGAFVSVASQSHVVIDGAEKHGITVLAPYRQCQFSGVRLGGSFNTVQYVLVDGNGDDWASVGVGMGGASNTLRHVDLVNLPNDAIKVSGNHLLIEYCSIGPYPEQREVNSCCGMNVCHADGLEISGADNVTIRYSSISCRGDTFIFGINSGESDNWDIYGNVFHDGGTVLKIQSANKPQTNIRFYNNTVVRYGGYVLRGQTFDMRNNLYFESSLVSNGSNYAVSADPFMDSSAGDFRLVAPLPPSCTGEVLGFNYQLDGSGNTRGADGVWDIGAYEYVSNGNQPPVLAPIGPKSAPAGQQLQFQVNATDAESDPLTFSASQN